MQGVVYLIVGKHVEGCEKRGLLLLHDQLLPQPKLLFQTCLGSCQSVAVNQLCSHSAEHQTGHHAHRCGADTEALACLHLVIVLHRLQSHLLQPLPTLCLQLWQHHLALHQWQQVGYLTDALTLLLGQHIEVLCKRSKGVVGRACYGYSALESVRVVGHNSI